MSQRRSLEESESEKLMWQQRREGFEDATPRLQRWGTGQEAKKVEDAGETPGKGGAMDSLLEPLEGARLGVSDQ